MLIQLVSLVYSPKRDDPMTFLMEWRLRRSLVLVTEPPWGLWHFLANMFAWPCSV